jgi:hypothetical protein
MLLRGQLHLPALLLLLPVCGEVRLQVVLELLQALPLLFHNSSTLK